MTEEQFKEMLKKHDFWFSMSDDHRVYTRGRAEREEINNALKSYPQFKPIWDEYVKSKE